MSRQRTVMSYPPLKRTIDVLLAGLGIIALSPVLAAVAVAVRVSSKGPVIFRQRRVGRDFVTFELLKFRTMTSDGGGPRLTVGADPRITSVGRFLRASKLDELPQLVNVLRGHMSLVGPRPELPEYVGMYEDDYKAVLSVRPGMTDLASIEYVDEARLLAGADDPEQLYVEEILPRKLALAKRYVEDSSLRLDMRIVFSTFRAIVRR